MNENARTFLKGYAQSKARVKNLVKALADHTAVSDDLRVAVQEAEIGNDLTDAIEAAEENMVAFKVLGLKVININVSPFAIAFLLNTSSVESIPINNNVKGSFISFPVD